MKRFRIGAFGLMLLAAGCSTDAPFVYRPSPATEAGTRLPLSLAVLPFADGTGMPGSGGKPPAADPGRLNLVKVGLFGMIDPVTPDALAKAFAGELAASGRFRAVRYAPDDGRLSGEDCRIEGTVEKAAIAMSGNLPNEFAIRLRALRGTDRLPAWENTVFRRWTDPPDLYSECARANLAPELAVRCYADRMHGRLNDELRGLFADAGAQLAAALARPAGGVPAAGEPKPVRPAESPGSVDELVDRILKGP